MRSHLSYSKANDKRRFLRYELLDYAHVYCTDEEPIKAVIVDIGLGGMQLRSRDQLEAGASCRVHIGRLNAEPIVLSGEVRHSKAINGTDLYSLGVRFTPDTHEEKLAIAEFVHGVFQRQCDSIAI